MRGANLELHSFPSLRTAFAKRLLRYQKFLTLDVRRVNASKLIPSGVGEHPQNSTRSADSVRYRFGTLLELTAVVLA